MKPHQILGRLSHKLNEKGDSNDKEWNKSSIFTRESYYIYP